MWGYPTLWWGWFGPVGSLSVCVVTVRPSRFPCWLPLPLLCPVWVTVLVGEGGAARCAWGLVPCDGVLTRVGGGALRSLAGVHAWGLLRWGGYGVCGGMLAGAGRSLAVLREWHGLHSPWKFDSSQPLGPCGPRPSI